MSFLIKNKGLFLSFLIFSMLLMPFITSAFDNSLLVELLTEEIKKSVIKKEVQIGQIKFIGNEPYSQCIPGNFQIREIKRPNLVEFTFICQDRQYRAIANYEILNSVYVTQRNLLRGETINQGDILEIKLPTSRIPAGAVNEINQILGKTLKRTIARGLIIKSDHIYPDIPVKKGSRVNITVISGQVTIMTEGVLKNDATVGSNVSVLCEQTGKEIAGVLIDKDKVRVFL